MNAQNVKDARKFALEAHGSQEYGSGQPYVYHLDKVTKVCSRYGGSATDFVISYLHDVIEDTKVTKEEIAKWFGSYVANIVDLVSNRPSKKETFERIRKSSRAVFIKLCDRIANVEEGGKVEHYKKQYPLFKSILYKKGEYESMWKHLDQLLS